MTTDRPLILRCDASVSIGTGHVMRCLALAQAWQDAGGQAVFVMASTAAAVAERLRDEQVRMVSIDGVVGGEADLGQTIAVARNENAAWVVTDGYQFGSPYQRALSNAGIRVLSLDDNGCLGASADFILNQNIHARQDLYPDRAPHTKLLLGTEYALLRREFVVRREYRREIPPTVRNLLVAMGGSDPDNVTSRVLDAVDQVNVAGLRVVVVAGGSNPHAASLATRVAASCHGCRLVANANNMADLISQADMAVSAAGTVCWEFCLLGLPAVLLPIAENQVAVAHALHAAGAAVTADISAAASSEATAQLITRLANSPVERASLSQKARTLVDGRGADRVLSSLMSATLS
jgi:UDP-2,4-diacetamido-2,4,6-trideoxy-beta-L-altropyranose hydrolase